MHLVTERTLRPRYICFLAKDDNISITDVEAWALQHPEESLNYLFVAYTTEQFSHESDSDMTALHNIAKRKSAHIWKHKPCERNALTTKVSRLKTLAD